MISGYMGVIPKDVRHHPKLKANAKVLYSEIMATLDENGICTKNNFYFSNVLNFTKETASRGIASLKNNGFINVVIENEKGTTNIISLIFPIPKLMLYGIPRVNYKTIQAISII